MISKKQSLNKKSNIFQSSTINKIIEYVYSQNFEEIIIKDKFSFINNIDLQILEMIKSNSKGNEIQYKSDLSLYQNQKPSILSRYDSEYSLLKSQYEKYKQNPNAVLYLKKYRKHCINSGVTPIHKCNLNNTFGKFIEVINSKNNNNYVICTECKFCYKISFIKIFCPDCKSEYYTSKLNENENENILPSTWQEYHCKPIIINEMMKCIKCENILYINLSTKNLICLNNKCNFVSNPRSIIWKCKICKKEFRSLAKVYNPLEKKILENEIWKALILKQKAKPKKLFCCLINEKNENIKFFHDKYCKGELFKGNINGNEIIICSKCHAVNFYDKFKWTCPKCNKKFSFFQDKKPITKKENDNNVNIKLKNNLKLNKEDKLKEEEHKKKNNNNSKNDLLFQYYFQLKKSINDKDEKEKEILKLKKNLLIQNNENNLNKNENNFQKESKPNYLKKLKKIKYKTLFDILEEKEKYKLENQGILNNDKTIRNTRNSLNPKSNKKRKKLLEESNLTSRKVEHNIIYKQYLSPFHSSNQDNKKVISKENIDSIIKTNLFKNSPNKFQVISSDKDEEINNYKDLYYTKRYKDEHSTTTNEDFEKSEFRKNTKSSKKNHKINLDFKKIFLKEKDDYYKNKNNKKKELDKNTNKNININNSEQKTVKREFSKNKEKNQLFKRIYLDKIDFSKEKRLNRSKDNIHKKILKEMLKPIDEYSTNIININNKTEIQISAFDVLNKSLLTKEDFFKISQDCKIPQFKESDINFINSIEIDSNSVIYLVEDKFTKKHYSLKRVICQDIQEILKQKKELELCYSLNHPNLIKIYNIYFKYLDFTTYILYILMEKADSTWEKEIEQRAETKNYYSEKELINIIKQLVDALLYLQKKGISHRNIKPSNILICENNTYKISDLDEVKENNTNENKLATLKGNQLFMAPNLFFVLKYDGNCIKVKHNLFKSDVFSLGYCFLYAMALDIKLIKNIREESSMNDVILIIKNYGIDKRYSKQFMDIIYKMIQTDENKRYDFYELSNDINKNF